LSEDTLSPLQSYQEHWYHMPTEGKKGDEKTATEKSKDIHLEGKLKWPKLYK